MTPCGDVKAGKFFELFAHGVFSFKILCAEWRTVRIDYQLQALQIMSDKSSRQFVQFSIATTMVFTVATAVFLKLMNQFGVQTVMPWYLFFCLVCVLFLIGRWLAISIERAAESDPSTPRKLATFNTAYEASVFVAKLERLGIDAKIVGGMVAGFQAEAPGYVDVLVSAHEYEVAVEASEKISSDMDSLPASD